MNRCECFDFPVSWSFYRAHCWQVHGFDPGNNEPPEHTVEELHERLAALEENAPEKPELEIGHHHEKPKPRLSGGVKL